MIFEAIANLIADRVDCDVSTITMDSKFSDLGIDSLDTVELLMNLEDEMLKASAGGGGRGIRLISSRQELEQQFPLAVSEARIGVLRQL